MEDSGFVDNFAGFNEKPAARCQEDFVPRGKEYFK
jgi:hypothetical protein